MKTMKTTKTGATPVPVAPPVAPPVASSAWSVAFSALLGGAHEPRDRDPTASPPKEERRKEREEEPPSHKAARAEVRVEPSTLPPTGPRAPYDLERPAAAVAPRPSDPPLQVIADQMLRGLCINQVGAQTSLRMELSTPRLSRVGIEMRVEAGRLSTRFRVPDLAGREILRASASELAAGLGQRGIDVEAIQIDLESEPAHDGRFGDRGEDRRQQERPRPCPRRQRRGGFVL